MASEILMLLLMLAIAFTATTAASTEGEVGQIFEEKDIVLDDGSLVHEVKTVDTNCRHENSTAIFADQSTSTVLNDFDEGKGLMLFSNTSDVCYVRDISEEEEQEVATCHDGTVERSASDAKETQQNFVEAGDLTIDELPRSLRSVCEGKRIIRMVEGSVKELAGNLTTAHEDGKNETGAESLPRVRRYVRCYYYLTCYHRYECRHTCFPWWCTSYRCTYWSYCYEHYRCDYYFGKK